MKKVDNRGFVSYCETESEGEASFKDSLFFSFSKGRVFRVFRKLDLERVAVLC